MSKYYVNFNTGTGNFYADTIEEAMERADNEACYTQQHIVICDSETNEVLYRRQWSGCRDEETENELIEDDEFDSDLIVFGDFGFYDCWRAA